MMQIKSRTAALVMSISLLANICTATAQDAKEQEALPPPPTSWSPEEVISARNACIKIMAGKEIWHRFAAPMRKGACGTPFPIKLVQLGIKTKLKVNPPATTTCALAASLSDWVVKDLQPLALDLFGEPVIGFRNVSSYACRHRNNDPSRRISQHAYANALDIASFELKSGKIITVKEDWTSQTSDGEFLRGIHHAACRRFGTVLGPEANEAHHDHFHLDRAKRRGPLGYCE